VNLVASLIVKNEIGRYLQPCIAHLRTFCDTIVVVDDGSTDNTGDWLEDQSSDGQIKVHRIDPEDGFFAGHEGRRRTMLLHHTMNEHPEWVLNIDADEFISDGALLRDWCLSSPTYVGTLPMQEVWRAEKAELALREDGGWRAHPIPCVWSGKLNGLHGRAVKMHDSALACGREPIQVRRLYGRAKPTGASIMHFGWACESCRQERYDRYVTADGGKFHRSTHLESIMWPDERVTLETMPWPTALKPFRDDILRAARGLP
jgi:glycosyltransferase involved in cell wall biosynthesis